MKKFILTLLFFFISANITLGYENQGFKSYNENNNKFNFECENQCFLIIGQKGNKNILNLNGLLNGTGQIGYGFINGQQIIPGEIINIDENGKHNEHFNMSNLSFYSQLNEDIYLALIIQGKIKGENISINIENSSLYDNIKFYYNDFFKIKSLTAYSINLRYGIIFGSTSIVKIGYILFFICLLLIFFIFKNKKNLLIYIGISIFLFIGYRNLYTYYNITKTGLYDFSFKGYEEKKFFDLGDYIVFTDKIRKKLDLDNKNNNSNCSIYIESISDWPFTVHFKSVYLKPCKFTDKIEKSDYIIYYKKEIPSKFKNNILINFNNSYLLKNNK